MISGCLAGDRKLWDVFVERFSKLIYWSILKVISRTEFAPRQDLVSEIYQEVFEKILDKHILLKLRNQKSLKTFICVLAGHTAMDKVKFLRRKSRSEISIQDMFCEDESGSQESLEAVLSRGVSSISGNEASAQEAALKVLDILDPKEKYALIARYSHGHSQAEIAAILGLPAGSVASMIHRAKLKIVDAVKAKGLEFED